jgi:hypothetical protein
VDGSDQPSLQRGRSPLPRSLRQQLRRRQRPCLRPHRRHAVGGGYIYVGGPNGGVFRSADDGKPWSAMTDLTTLSIGDIRLAPDDALWLATANPTPGRHPIRAAPTGRRSSTMVRAIRRPSSPPRTMSSARRGAGRDGVSRLRRLLAAVDRRARRRLRSPVEDDRWRRNVERRQRLIRRRWTCNSVPTTTSTR